MRPILPEEVEAYVRSGEWEGKAGGYAIQETADAFVASGTLSADSASPASALIPRSRNSPRSMAVSTTGCLLT